MLQATSDFREDDAEVIRLLCYTRVKLRQERVLQRANVVESVGSRSPRRSGWWSALQLAVDDRRRIDDEWTTN